MLAASREPEWMLWFLNEEGEDSCTDRGPVRQVWVRTPQAAKDYIFLKGQGILKWKVFLEPDESVVGFGKKGRSMC